MKLLPPCLFLVPHLLPQILLKWWPSYLQPLIPKGRVRLAKSIWENPAMTLGRAHNTITDDLWTSSEVSRPSLLTNWSVVTFTNWCRYFTQLLLLLIEFLHLLKVLTLLSSSGSQRIPALDDTLSDQWRKGSGGQFQGWFSWGWELEIKEGSDWGNEPSDKG